MTASFAGTSSPPGGATWATATVGALVSLALFTLAAWGVFRSKWWWERAASAGAIVGLATLVPYWIAASSTPEPALNKPIHIVGSAAVLLVLLVPALERRLKAWLSDPDSPAPAGRRSR
jgi:peptidoglycan/LPS O-acetylase OafA/YrhL